MLLSSYKKIDNSHHSSTNLNHILFGLLGSVDAWHHRKAYTESWWRPNATRGSIYLDKEPTGELLPWSTVSPPYKVSDDLMTFLQETKAPSPVTIRMVHGIMEVVRDHANDLDNPRWVVMGDDDSIFFVDNMVDVLGEYDHTKYHYLGGQSEFIMSNFWFSFNQAFGGAGIILSYPLAKALADTMDDCLARNSYINSADLLTMICIVNLGVNFSPLKGIHQMDLHGDISGFLSYHPKFPLLSLHHLDAVEPIFPNMDRFDSTRHLMTAAAADQSRMLQQTICHHRQSNWSMSVSWGYSVHIYERIMTRIQLMNPIETFQIWYGNSRPAPQYMFNTRLPSKDPCEAPHVFFLHTVQKNSTGILTTYTRAAARELPACIFSGHSADNVSEIHVFSPDKKRKDMDRCECCDIVGGVGAKAELQFRECRINEIIA